MLKNLQLCSLVTVLMGAGTLFAQEGAEKTCPSQWGVSADYLYLKPSVDDTYFVLKNGSIETAPTGKRHNNDFSYNSGFRVGASYALCNCNTAQDMGLFVNYTRLNVDEKKSIKGSALWATAVHDTLAGDFAGYEGEALSKIDLRYQSAELMIKQRLRSWCHHSFSFLYGAEYANIKLAEKFDYSDITSKGNVHEKSEMWGVGPQFGFNLNYSLYSQDKCSFSFGAKVTGSLLASHTSAFNKSGIAGQELNDIRDYKTWRLLPAFHSNLGFTYNHGFADKASAFVRVGYELNSYLRAVSKMVLFGQSTEAASFNTFNNFDIHGLVVSAGLKF